MAEPKRKTSKGSKNRRRSHIKTAKVEKTVICKSCGKPKRAHRECQSCGKYEK